ncbi:MAG: prephenate dehydrogenase/arogenate dehydrogenase family protein [Chloroflexi bacterium]|nr:prephenate dehydrogenase/arogenate dehydrogenase family protein [Chloroflexota bacterium]
MSRITIIGLGLIGGSLGLAIKAAGHKDVELVGYDYSGRVRREAKKRGAVDDVEGNVAKAVDGAGLVIVAVPPVQIIDVFKEMGSHLSEGAAVTDVASSKRLVLQWADEFLPRYCSFVGGHPMAGKTDQGIENAEAGLFKGAPYAVVPTTTASETAVRSVLGMVETIGATARFMAADEHDDLVGAVSHMPILASNALFTMLRGTESWADFGKMAGPAYRDLTRLVDGDPQMSAEIALTNKERIQYWLDRYILELNRYRDLLDEDEETIFNAFFDSNLQRFRFLQGDDLDDVPPVPEMPDKGAVIGGLMLSPKLYDKMREMMKHSDETIEKSRRRR